jgi:putative tricarboxylic transport membrane protein
MSNSPQRDVRGIAGSALFIVVGILAIWGSRDFTPLGSVFPRTIATAMIVFAAAYIVMALLRHGKPVPRQAGSTGRRLALVVVLVAWAFLLEPVGFLTTSIAAYCALLAIANYDRWTARMAVTYGAVGALVLGGLYSIFFFALDVPLPQGLLR